MNDRPGTAPKAGPFDLRSVGFYSIPGQSRLFLDFLDQSVSLEKFYPNKHADLKVYAGEVLKEYPTDRNRLCDALLEYNKSLGAGSETLVSIEKLRCESCVTVITGQQAGLFTGPVYTIYKAVSAILLAKELTESGIEAVPVFWIASEDHDLDEAAVLNYVDEGGALKKQIFRGEGQDLEDVPVGKVRLGSGISNVIDEVASALAATPNSEKLFGDLSSCYTGDEDFSGAFGKLLHRLLGKYGLILVSPLEPEIRSLAAPLVERAVEKAAEVSDALRRRDREIESLGYHSQVHVGDEFFPFFYLDDRGVRAALRQPAGGEEISRADGKGAFSKDELLRRYRDDPSILSPNALMRPVVQDFLFPNVCYFGGSAEIAYFAQNSVIYELLGRPVTQVRHRSAFSIIEPRNRRTLESYGLRFEDIFSGREALMAGVIEKSLHPEVANAFEDTEAQMESLLDDLGSGLSVADPTLAESLSKRRKKMLWHLHSLRKKFGRAETVKDDVVRRRLEYLCNTLYPEDGLQERTLGAIHFLNLFGDQFIEWLIEAASPDQTDHRVLTL